MMKEEDYIKATNLTKMRIAEQLLRDVLPGDEYGINLDDYRLLIHWVEDITNQANKKVMKSF